MHHDPTTDRPIVRQAVHALRSFGDPLDREQAAKLLPMWRHYHALEQHEAAAALATFPPAGPHAAAPVRIVPETGWAAATATCSTCTGALVWRQHPDRGQSGWAHQPDGGEQS